MQTYNFVQKFYFYIQVNIFFKRQSLSSERSYVYILKIDILFNVYFFFIMDIYNMINVIYVLINNFITLRHYLTAHDLHLFYDILTLMLGRQRLLQYLWHQITLIKTILTDSLRDSGLIVFCDVFLVFYLSASAILNRFNRINFKQNHKMTHAPLSASLFNHAQLLMVQLREGIVNSYCVLLTFCVDHQQTQKKSEN